jgi:Flp pilus assembly protein TadD
VEKRPDLQAAYQQVAKLINNGRLNEAEVVLSRILAERPDDTYLLNKKGVIYARRGDYLLAEEQFQQVIGLDPLNAPAWSNLGNVSLNTGRLDQAILHYERAISINPEYNLAYENLAAAYRQQGNLEQSVAVMKRTKLTRRSKSLFTRLVHYLRNMGT